MSHIRKMAGRFAALVFVSCLATWPASAATGATSKPASPDTVRRSAAKQPAVRATAPTVTPAKPYSQVARPPAPPSNMGVLKSGSTADGYGYNFVVLMWKDNAPNESEFVVERWEASAYRVLGRTGANETFFEDVGADPMIGGRWRVKACNARGCSGYAEFAPIAGSPLLKPKQESSNQSDRGDGGGGGGAGGAGWIGLGIDYVSEALGEIAETGNAFVQSITNPVYQAYQVYFAIVGANATMRSLPEDVIQVLKPYYGEALLREVRYGSSNHTTSENTAMTDCKNIYFPNGSGDVVVIKEGRLLARNSQGRLVNEGTMRLLLHELQHARQCADIFGRANYGARWFSELTGTVITQIIVAPTSVSSKSIHDHMPMEGDAASMGALAGQL